jgi:3-methyladenine DNA glycosylase AlkD
MARSSQKTGPRSPWQGKPAQVAGQIRRFLKAGGSPEHAAEVRWYLQKKIRSRGWYTADLRRAVREIRREILRRRDFPFLTEVADLLFSGAVLEEKIAAVFLLEALTAECGDREFQRFENWLDRITSWADHDALVHDLMGPMLVAQPGRIKTVSAWARSSDRWHRRAACVAMIRGTRARKFFPQIIRLSQSLLADQDLMVQKGLGWLLRETAKYDPGRSLPYLLKIRSRAPRLVLRTACETLSPGAKRKILRPAP